MTEDRQFQNESMGSKTWIRFLLTLVAVQINLTLTSLSFTPNFLRFNTKLEGKTFRTILQVSVKQCLEECRSRPNCMSFNYVSRSHVCELNTEKGTYQLKEAPGYVFSDELGDKEVHVCACILNK